MIVLKDDAPHDAPCAVGRQMILILSLKLAALAFRGGAHLGAREENQRHKKRGTAKKAKKVNPRSPCSVGLGWVFWVGLRAWDFPTERALPRPPFKSQAEPIWNLERKKKPKNQKLFN
jgi:hypothetical protein